jgi:GT2 family glycosyltransferase/tetratricopeptide (TPR) repeat protein
MPRYLFGPVNPEFAADAFTRSNDLLFFDTAGKLEITVPLGGTWDDLAKNFPEGWQPDALVLWLYYSTIPAALYNAPLPIVTLAPDWNLLFHDFRRILKRSDLVFTDQRGVSQLKREGIEHVRYGNLWGLSTTLAGDWFDRQRDIDVLFVGNIHPDVQRERNAWLGRLAKLGSRWNIVIKTGVFGAEYRELLSRAKIVFNRSIRGECNQRAFEAAAAGALLLQERENEEVPLYLKPRSEYVVYDAGNLEQVIEHYLTHDSDRQAIASAARMRVPEFTGDACLGRILQEVEASWSELEARAKRRNAVGSVSDVPMSSDTSETGPTGSTTPGLMETIWSALSSGNPAEVIGALREKEELTGEHLEGAQRAASRDSLGRLFAAGLCAREPEKAAACFDRVLDFQPSHLMAGLNRAEALASAKRNEEAVAQARRTLKFLELDREIDPDELDLPHYPAFYPTLYDSFRVDWDQAAWMNAGDRRAETLAKQAVLRGRLHALLARLTDDLTHYHAAAMAGPHIGARQAALGCALARAGRLAEALPPLRAAVAANPFDRAAAQALYNLLGESGDHFGRAMFARQQNNLHRAAPERIPLEKWMENPPLSGRERTSIIVVACNAVELTRLCLESILRHTHGDYELILVENGSTDGVPQLFERFDEPAPCLFLSTSPERIDEDPQSRQVVAEQTSYSGASDVKRSSRSREDSRQGPARIEIIRNETNRGYAAGINRGLAVAEGEFIVLLDNDTVVTPGWLEGMIAYALYHWPNTGLVGPVSNCAPEPQRVDPGYERLDDLDSAARRRRRQFLNRGKETQRLSSFCLLMRRAVLRRIGGYLDEQFGLGLFEDDDLCMRVRQAGLKLCVAQDVYVHHFGGTTFQALGIDPAKQKAENLELFRQKWGEPAVRPEAAPQSSAATPAGTLSWDCLGRAITEPNRLNERRAAVPTGWPKVSLCVIARNEEKNLPECLGPLRGIVDEIVVLDTGSTDNTKQVAESFGARVFEMPWSDSFAAARNASMEHARGEFIFWMDADDRVTDETVAKLKELFAELDSSENYAYSMKCVCVASYPGGTVTVVDHIRLFRNDPQHRWQYRVHEQILPAVRRNHGDVKWPGITILHTGYTDPALRRRKLDRDLRLLHLDEKDHPDDPFILFNLGSVYHELKQPKDALPALNRSLERCHEKDSIVRKLYALIAQCHRELHQSAEALQTCAKGRSIYPDDPELLFLESMILRERGDTRTAEERLHRLINGSEDNHFSSVDAGLRGYKARHNLAVLCVEQQRFPEAETHWIAANQEEPAFFPAQIGLGELYAKSKKWDKLERHAAALSNRFGAHGDEIAQYLLGLGKMHAGELSAARFRLKSAAAQFPKSLRIKRLLAEVTLKEGVDLIAAEQVLREILELDPSDEKARKVIEGIQQKHNLGANGSV